MISRQLKRKPGPAAKMKHWAGIYALLISLAYPLAACVTAGDGEAPSATAALPPASDDRQSTETARATDTAHRRQARRPAGPAPLRMKMVQLVGLTGPELVLLLGPPALKRREAAAEVWQYSGTSCVLHLFFYDSRGRGGFQVVHAEATNRSGALLASDSCLTRLLQDAESAGRAS